MAPLKDDPKQIALFIASHHPPPNSWFTQAQTEASEGDETESGASFEIMSDDSLFGCTVDQLAVHFRQQIIPSRPELCQNSFVIADGQSEDTNSLIIVQLRQSGSVNAGESIMEGFMRSHPYNCIVLAQMFDANIQGIGRYAGSAEESPNKVLPSFRP